jgi:hypothetical protein
VPAKNSGDRDWDAELAKIDRQIAATSPEKLAAMSGSGDKPGLQPTVERRALPSGAGAGSGAVAHKHRPMAAWARLLLGLALGVGMLFWPYPARCGVWLGLYLMGVTVLTAGGVWAAVWTWRHRTPRAHVLALLLVLEGLVLAGLQVLPKTGYARPDAGHPANWSCST